MKFRLAKIFRKPPKLFPDDHIQYYYLKRDVICCDYEPQQMFPNIGPYQFKEVIKNLSDHYGTSSYYHNLHNSVKSISYKKEILEQTSDNDEIITQYIKCRPQTTILTIWPLTSDENYNKLLKQLERDGNVYYTKNIQLTYNGARNLIYQLYSDIRRLSDMKKIEEKLDYMKWGKTRSENAGDLVRVIVFDNINNKNISGGQALYKTQLRNILLEGTEGLRGDDLMHINDNYYQTIEYAQMYFNENSIKFLNRQDLKRFLSREFSRSKILFNTYKKWVTTNLDQLDMNRFMLMGSTVLYTHGVRPPRDFDGLSSGLNVTKEYVDLLKKYFYNKNSKFYWGDMGIEAWHDSWVTKNREWCKLMGVKDMEEVMLNPKHHYYFLGVKFIKIRYNVIRRIMRGKPRDFADIYMINKLLNMNIKINGEELNDEYINNKGPKVSKEIKYYLNRIYDVK
jgi:hypothetical protein